ncbi:MAG: hypothetical protein HN383_14740 [Verrucomicrobia bacterium]|jgi:hypothetical protein|nr:hypothetical protein [Verrucomicrobiota bacterium]MBT7701326.1 hypothetical protein [Verrucomicrobiota bacterium]
MKPFRHTTGVPILTAAVLLLLVAGTFHRPLLKERRRALPEAVPLTGASPVVVFTTVVLGGFRGVIADTLWLRASYLQDEERYLELVQLADWITKLEPRTTDIWAFHAWNMAYNVSVMMPMPEDRWRWVQQGIRLLRDEGLRYNPSDPRIYQELGWIYQHKLGSDSDRLHAYYKQQWSQIVTAQLGLTGRANYAALAADPARVTRIHKALGLDLERMQVVDALYGPLDWRVPQSHAVYWAYQGLQVAGDEGYLPCSRMIYQSMAELFLWGRHRWERDGQLIMQTDNRLLPRVVRAYEDALRRYDDPTLHTSYANFLAGATLVLAERGDPRRSRRAFNQLHTRYPSPQTHNGYQAFIAAQEPR